MLMLALIPLLPFAGFVVNAFLGKRLPKSVSGGLACLAMLGSFAVSAVSVWTLVNTPDVPWLETTLYRWIASGDFQIPLQFRLDHLSSLMILVITGIGSLIHIYSTAYMHEETDSEYARYFSYLNLFASFMLVLVLGSSFPVMFVGWEGVGLCSYLLIGFWFKKKSAGDAGKKAFIVNRIGDFGFILGMLMIFVLFGSLDFQQVAAAAASRPVEHAMGAVTVATLLLFLGATGKSAQIPLFTWLPDAMEGPTPVSALIHAATMVTAGVYMIGRNAVLFQHAPITLAVVAGIGVATALMAGTIGLVQNDIKRVLAYSTVSQLGYMFLAMGVGAYGAGIFHLYTHAFFKALLFLGSGAVIHALAGEQDIRNMGGLKKALPITYWTFLIGAIAIAGVPPLAGFFSKDEILFRTFSSGRTLLWGIGILTSLLTATYMFRLVFLTFHGERRHDAPSPAEPVAHASDAPPHLAPRASRLDHGHDAHLHDAPPAMAAALIVLALGSIAAGWVGVPHALKGHNEIETFLEPSFEAHAMAPATEFQVTEGRPGTPETASGAHEVPAASEETELLLMGVSTGLALTGIGLAWYFWRRNRPAADGLARTFAPIHTLLLNKYYVDELYDALVVRPIGMVSVGLWKGADAVVIDGSVNGVGRAVQGTSAILRHLQSGSVRAYAASLFLGVVLILGWYLLR
jgi:NADH-quinone oxidoreductase subunit L